VQKIYASNKLHLTNPVQTPSIREHQIYAVAFHQFGKIITDRQVFWAMICQDYMGNMRYYGFETDLGDWNFRATCHDRQRDPVPALVYGEK
jgi:hypothetical protein